MGSPKSKNQKKILIISPWERRWSLGSGAGVSDDDNFIRRASKVFELHFLRPKGPDTDATSGNLFVHTYPNFFTPTRNWPTHLKRLLWPVLFNAIVTPRAVLLARRIGADFVLGHSHHGALTAYVTRQLLGIPSGLKLFGVMDLVHTEWSRWKYLHKNVEQIAALKIPQDLWIILDDGTKGDEAARRHGIAEDKIHFLPNGIDLAWLDRAFDGGTIRRQYQIPPDAAVVLFLSRLVDSKRPWEFIQAAPFIKAKTTRRTVFLIVGEGDGRAACEALSRRLGVEQDIVFAGAIEHERVPEVMAASDVFVSTSRLTNVAIPTCEAFVCGLPVVAFDVGNTVDIVRDGETGRVVPDGDVPALAEAVAGLLESDGLRRRMSQRQREFARAQFTGWDERIQTEIDIINEIISAANR